MELCPLLCPDEAYACASVLAKLHAACRASVPTPPPQHLPDAAVPEQVILAPIRHKYCKLRAPVAAIGPGAEWMY